MEANKRTLSDIFNGNRILEIPFFQRTYVWSEDQWERLMEDLETVSVFNKPYFLGSVILKQQPTPAGGSVGDKRTLIDGQQRLTTLNILLKVLCLKTNMNARHDRVFRLAKDNSVALLHNHFDIIDFNAVLDLEEEIEIKGNSQIIRAYEYFRKNIRPESLDLDSILTNIMFVGIDLSPDEDEQQIFDTINSLGVRLTTAELLKNYFFQREDQSSYNKNWKEVFEGDEDSRLFWNKEISAGRAIRENIDIFFYSFLQIKVQDQSLAVSSEDRKSFTRLDGLFDSYKRFIKDYNIDKDLLIQEINEYARIYRENIKFNVTSDELISDYSVNRINAIIFGLDNTTVIPYVLYILKEVSNSNERNLIWEYLESYLMRRLVCHSVNNNYNNLFSEKLLTNSAITKDILIQQIESQSATVNRMPNDEELMEGFHRSKLVNKQSTGILYMLESAIRNRSKHSTALLGINKYSLEHVMPKKWENKWSKVASEEEKNIRNFKLQTLGNLTIITQSLNASIRDSSWDVKKEGSIGNPGLKQYASGIETFSSFLDKREWTEAVIEERAEFLYSIAIKVWKK
jgi:uncharacterized protein with ParB-like and HNH nuclease domain